MGDINQYTFVRDAAAGMEGPYLEIGSRDYGNTQDLRSLFTGKGKYVGIDMQAGKSVDLVLDLTQDFAVIDEALEGQRFGTIFCLSVLEHCDKPFHMAENITKLLAPGGKACISVPFVWHFHGYPSDYWRFTHEGVKKLFPDLEFTISEGVAATSQAGNFSPLDEAIGKIPYSTKFHRRRGHMLRSFSAGAFKLLGKVGMFRWLMDYPYVMAPTMVTMVGTPRQEQGRAAA